MFKHAQRDLVSRLVGWSVDRSVGLSASQSVNGAVSAITVSKFAISQSEAMCTVLISQDIN